MITGMLANGFLKLSRILNAPSPKSVRLVFDIMKQNGIGPRLMY